MSRIRYGQWEYFNKKQQNGQTPMFLPTLLCFEVKRKFVAFHLI